MNTHSDSRQTHLTVIDSRSLRGSSQLKELWSARDLILLFVKRDFVTLYKQTVLGPLWFLIQPLLMTIVFTVVFDKIANIPTDGIPSFLFYMSGIVPWSYFAANIEKNSSIFVSNQATFSKVYFPRLAVPIATVITNLFALLIQFSTFFLFLTYYLYIGTNIEPNWWAIWITPLLLIQIATLGMGVGLLISALTVKYRDLVFVVSFGIQLWMYATPIVYPLSQASPKLQLLLSLNPMTGVIEVIRFIYFGTDTLKLQSISIGIFSSLVTFGLGVYLFRKVERSFIDTV